MTTADVRVLVGDEVEPARARAVLTASYGEDRFGEDWYRWKHVEGPWGPSVPSLATSDDGDLGVVFALPWRYRCGDLELEGPRVVDGGTLPAARGRGVLKAVIRAHLDRWTAAGRAGLFLATATPAARASHVKNGAVALEPLRYRLGVPRALRRARLRSGDEVLVQVAASAGDRIITDWSAESLRWRTDHRSGNRYDAVALAHADHPNGLVYRVVAGYGAKLLVPLTIWGYQSEVRALLGAAVRAAGCVGVRAPAGSGALPLPARWLLLRDEVLLCVWNQLASAANVDPNRLDSWGLSAGEVEGLI